MKTAVCNIKSNRYDDYWLLTRLFNYALWSQGSVSVIRCYVFGLYCGKRSHTGEAAPINAKMCAI